MALLRLFYRKRKVLLMLLFMSLFWIVFLYLSMPSAQGFKKKKGHREKSDVGKQKLLTEVVLRSGGIVPPVNLLRNENGQNSFRDTENKENQNVPVIKPPFKEKTHALPLEPPNLKVDSAANQQLKNDLVKTNYSKADVRVTTKKQKIGKVDKMLQLGEHIKNKTLQVGAQMKNKTLQKLSDLGLIAKPKPVIKKIGKMAILNITMSSDEFLFVIRTLIKDSERKSSKLTVTKTADNSSALTSFHGNTTNGMTTVQNLCDCYKSECTCCAQLQLIKLHVSRKACTNFTFMPKSQEVEFKFLLDGKLQYTETISAEHPPKICLGSLSKAVEICVDFYNMSFSVNMHEEHKTQLNGCLDFGFNVYNKTISTFHLGCFQIPSGKHREEDGHNHIPLLGNWVP